MEVRMRIAVGADHAGFPLKETLTAYMRDNGYDVIDLGTQSEESVDYPDFARALGEVIQAGRAKRGILICGSGVGSCVAANKMRGIRAAICHDTYSAAQGVEHNDMNVLCLGARVIGLELAKVLIRAFLSASFKREERYVRRLTKIEALEQHGSRGEIEDKK
jgi:ribose 5-phosphate isomerase B